jgi:rubrerythrin
MKKKDKVEEKKFDSAEVSYAKGYLEGLLDSTWTCLDCGNIYQYLTEECPNRDLDQAKASLRGAEYRNSMS